MQGAMVDWEIAGETLVDLVAIAGLALLGLIAVETSEGLALTIVYAIAGLGGFKMYKRGKTK